MPVESIEIEVLSRRLASITDEMYFSIQRAARSSYVKEAADFATALLDRDGNVFAYPPSATFAFLIDTDFKTTIDAVPYLRPGDVILTNDPYTSGALSTHLPDLHVICPYFHEGEIVAYGWSFVHCADVGGAVPGSLSAQLTSIFQEGLRLPPLKIVKAGRLNDDIVAVLRTNSRMPDSALGDLKAMLGGMETGRARIEDLIRRHGVDTLIETQAALQDYAASKSRDVLRRIPDGSYEFWDYLDDDAVTGIPVRVRVKVAVLDGEIALDFDGTDPHVRSAFNVPTMGRRMYWLTFRLTSLLTTYGEHMPHNAGMYRSMSVSIPRGSLLDARYPDAVGLRGVGPRRLYDCVTGALMHAAPDLFPAPSGGLSVTLAFSEIAPDGFSRVVEVLQPVRCGMGALADRDGVDARDNSLNNMRNHPLEVVEADSSVRIVSYDIHPDSGGAGRYRGGVGQSITVEVLCDGGMFLTRGLDRMRFPAWGVAGGQPGALLSITLNKGTPDERRLEKIHEFTVARGDRMTLELPGGGGYGDPLSRSLGDVLNDVLDGFVTVEGAARDYGVYIAGGVIDAEATQALRAKRGSNVRMFTFGPDRDAWEEVFSDDLQTDMNRRLYALPKLARQRVRQEIFEAAVPGITHSTGPVRALIPEPALAREQLQAAIKRLLPPIEEAGATAAVAGI